MTDQYFYFCIKAMPQAPALKLVPGRTPWTTRLAELTETTAATPAVRLSGPFGNTDFDTYENLVLFAGGIGITPMIALFTHMLHRALAGTAPRCVRSATLVWMTRNMSDFRLFEEFFELYTEESSTRGTVHSNGDDACIAMSAGNTNGADVKPNGNHKTESNNSSNNTNNNGGMARLTGRSSRVDLESGKRLNINGICFHIQLHCTSKGETPHPNTTSTTATAESTQTDYFQRFVVSGRCNAPAVLAQANPGPRTVAAACGPAALSLSVSQAAWELGCDFHAEEFAF